MKKLDSLVALVIFFAFSSLAVGQNLSFDQLAEAMQEQIDDEGITKRTPTSIGDFRKLEDISSKVSEAAVRATVGVRLGVAYASGVIVSEDGYVLTASHVAGAPNRSVEIRLSDGRKTRGRTLGMNPDVDGALIKIDESGPWPFVPMAEKGASVEPGDWCIATGHPGGFETGRAPPVRLGRVIFANGYTVRSDCPIEPGDSGGPLIDLQGKVIGVHSRIFDDTTGNLHVPIETYWRTWDRLKAGEVSRVSPSSSFLAQFDRDEDGQLTLEEIPTGDRREAYRRLGKLFEFDVDEPQDLNSLRSVIGLDLSKRSEAAASPGNVFFSTTGVNEMLKEFEYTRGLSLLNVLRSATDKASKATVSILVDGDDQALGAIVDGDGWVVTKASEIETADPDARLNVQLFDSRRFLAKIVHVDRPYDLAWLKIEGKDLPIVPWKNETPAVGRWVVSTSRGRTPVSCGVISVAGREIQSTPGFMGVGGSQFRDDAYVNEIIRGSGAADSDLQIGDTITEINGVEIRSFPDLKREVEKFLAGDILRVKVQRDGDDAFVTIRLGHRPDPTGQSEPEMMGPLSDRRNGFPFAFRHDTVLAPEECGGPLINLDGEVVGINIARKQRTGSLAIPAETIRQLLPIAKRKLENSEDPS